jgi:hypothetical protein
MFLHAFCQVQGCGLVLEFRKVLMHIQFPPYTPAHTVSCVRIVMLVFDLAFIFTPYFHVTCMEEIAGSCNNACERDLCILYETERFEK